MNTHQFDRLQLARQQLTQARKAFERNATASLQSNIVRLLRDIRRLSMQRWTIEFTDTFAGEANYCFVRRFSVMASSVRGAAIVAGRHLGYSGRLRCNGQWGDGARYDVQGAALCFFVAWFDSDREDMDEYWPLVNGKGCQQ